MHASHASSEPGSALAWLVSSGVLRAETCCAGAHIISIGAYEGPGKDGVNAQYKYPNGIYPHTVISKTQVNSQLLAGLTANLLKHKYFIVICSVVHVNVSLYALH